MRRRWLAVGVVIVAGCADTAPVAVPADSDVTIPAAETTTTVTDSTTPATTSATTTPPTTASPTTIGSTPAPTTSAATPTTVLPVPVGFAECVDRLPAAPVDLAASPWLGVEDAPFGPVGAEPALDVVFPLTTTQYGDEPPLVGAGIVAGRLLVTAHAPATGDGANVDAPPTVMALVDADGTLLWQRCLPATWWLREMSTELAGATMTDYDANQVWLVDASTAEITEVADPGPVPDVAWEPPPVLYDAPGRHLVVTEPDGETEIWRDESVTMIQAEGFFADVVDDVLLARVCLSGETDGTCDSVAIRAYDAADGSVLWTMPDRYAVVAAADGVALVAGVDDSTMVDLHSGEPVTEQRWPSPTFDQACCGEGDYVWASRAGAVVFDADGPLLRVWMPADLSGRTVTVAVPT